MALSVCSICKRRQTYKLATAYWAWFNADGARSAWKLRYCLEDAETGFSSLLRRLRDMDGSSEIFACVSCGSEVQDDSDPIYLTLYLPGKPQMVYELQLDGACAAKLRIPITQNGERLPDRNAGVGGRESLTSAWDALGLSPAEPDVDRAS